MASPGNSKRVEPKCDMPSRDCFARPNAAANWPKQSDPTPAASRRRFGTTKNAHGSMRGHTRFASETARAQPIRLDTGTARTHDLSISALFRGGDLRFRGMEQGFEIRDC